MKKILLWIFFVVINICGNPKPFGDDILLIINYNFPHYESIEFLKKIYGSWFPHIVFYGAACHSDAIKFDSYRGWYAYGVILDAMKRFPDYQGYLCLHDDCVLNYWNLSRFDKRKIWADMYCKADLTKGNNAVPGWCWWTLACGYNAIKNVYDQLPAKYIESLVQNYGPRSVCWGYSDIVYIPARYRNEAIEILDYMFKKKVFLEIAIPTLCSCLDKEENCEHFKGLALWTDRREIFIKYRTDFDYVHPFKFSLKKYRDFIQRKFDMQGVALSNITAVQDS